MFHATNLSELTYSSGHRRVNFPVERAARPFSARSMRPVRALHFTLGLNYRILFRWGFSVSVLSGLLSWFRGEPALT